MTRDNSVVLFASPQERRVAELRERLLLARQKTQESLGALRVEISEQTDWREWVRDRPAVFLTAAFLAGFLLARRG